MKLFFLATFLLLGTHLFASESQKITVTGEGSVTIPASHAQVQMGVEVTHKQASVVQDSLKKKSNALMKFLKSEKVQELKTESYQLQPERNYNSNKQKGYKGVSMISFKVPLTELGVWLDKSQKNGINHIRNIYFLATPEAQAKAESEALTLAAKEALKKGKLVLSSLGLEYKSVDRIQVGSIDHGPRPFARMALRESSPSSVDIAAGAITVKKNVTLMLNYR